MLGDWKDFMGIVQAEGSGDHFTAISDHIQSAFARIHLHKDVE